METTSKLGPVGSGAFFLTVGQRWSDIRKGSGNYAPLCCGMITGPQIKTARVLLGWSVPDLARRTGIDIANIQDLESTANVPNRRRKDLELITAILEEAGIEFIDSVGVQFRPAGLENMAGADKHFQD